MALMYFVSMPMQVNGFAGRCATYANGDGYCRKDDGQTDSCKSCQGNISDGWLCNTNRYACENENCYGALSLNFQPINSSVILD